MSLNDAFAAECAAEIKAQGCDAEFRELTNKWINKAQALKYSYHFEWMGRPIIQYPQDIVAMQELIWKVKPDLIIETGIAHGGSLIFSASMLALLDLTEAATEGRIYDPASLKRKVLGIDIDIRSHNLEAIKNHPMASRIEMIEGSSVDADVLAKVKAAAAGKERVLVCLDSNHTHEHVVAELEAYAPLVSVGSYCVVFDSIIEDLEVGSLAGRHWGPGDNPKTALREFLKTNPHFVTDDEIDNKIQISVAPEGYLKRIA